MDTKSIEELKRLLSQNPDFAKALSVVLDEKLSLLDSVSGLDQNKPNIGLQALAQIKAVEILRSFKEELLSARQSQPAKKSYH